MFEVIASERSYLRSLLVLIEHFMESSELSNTLIVMDKKTLFSNILRIKEVSERWASMRVCVCIENIFTVIAETALTEPKEICMTVSIEHICGITI